MGVKMSDSKRSGQVLIMTTLMIVPLVGALGMVTDFGYMHYVKETAQSAAQSAAQAAIIDFHSTLGGGVYSCGGSGGMVVCAASPTACTSNITAPVTAIDHGCMYAQHQGFNSATAFATYEANVNSTPPTATGNGNVAYWVTFRAVQKVPQLFSAILGNTSGLVVARSTAALVGSQDCIYALNTTAPDAISVGGTSNLTSACGIWSNSNNACSLYGNGSSTISAPEYDVVGGTCTNPLTPAPNTGVLPISDPMASVPAPAASPYTCDAAHTNVSLNKGTITLYPGTYCGGINVGNATVNLQPGTYIIDGGGLSTQSTNSTLTGTNVMIYNTYDSKHAYAPVSLDANSTVSLTANPTDPNYPGVLYFEDRTATCKGGCTDSFGGGSSAIYTGIIYAPNSNLVMDGNSSLAAYTLLIADTISLTGTTYLNADYSSLVNGSPIEKTVMLE